jgi:hypothetical protein
MILSFYYLVKALHGLAANVKLEYSSLMLKMAF